MTSTCPICGCDKIEPGDVLHRLLDRYWPEDEHADHLGLKRALENEYDITITVSQLKQHVDEHVTYRYSPDILSADSKGGGSE